MTFQKFSPFKCIGNLCWPCRKKGQGHPKVIIYIHIVDLESLVLHAKFQDPRPLGSGEEDFYKVFTIYGHGGNLGHVT